MTDVNQLIVKHLDVWTSAIEKKSSAGRGNGGGVSLYGVKKLRELILELAVRGKLVPQLQNEGSGENLKDEVLRSRAAAIRSKRMRKQKELPEISDDEVPFQVPTSWALIRLGELTNYGVTDKAEARDIDDGVWVLELEDVEKISSRLLQRVYFSERRFKSSKNRFLVGDVIYGKLRPYLDKVLIADEDGVCTTEMIPMRAFGDVSSDFLRLFLKSPEFIRYADDSTHGMNLPRLGTEKARMAAVPLPPLAEQRRIVAKVDELMGLCDALERQAEDSLNAHQTLVQTCLATLTNSQSHEDLTQNWTRIEVHFDTLFTTEESLAELDKTVLQLGMMGLLVKQDLSMSNVSLLETARKTRAALVARKEAKAFKAKATNEVLDWPFNLPSGWSWLRLGEAAVLITKGSSPKWQGVSYTDDPNEVMFVTSENVGRFEMLLDNPKFVERKFNTVEPRSILKAGDYLMNIVGASIGRTAIYPGPDGANINQAVCLIRVLPGLFDPRFLIAFFNSEFCRGYMFDKQVDNARANLSMGNIAQFLIPVPPIEEQMVIAEKLELLSGLSSNLSRRLQTSAMLSKSLADTLTSKIH